MNVFKVMLLAYAIVSGLAALGSEVKNASVIYIASSVLYLLVAVAEHMNYL